MKFIRIVYRLVLIITGSVFFNLLILSGHLLKPLGVSNYKVGAWGRKKWGQFLCKVTGVKLNIIGDTPEPPFFLVSNHLSYSDVWVLFACLDCTFIAKSEVKKWPLIGMMISSSGILFVNRDRRTDVSRVNKEISEVINEYQGVVLFPEGTTSPGHIILPFKSSLFQYPAQENIPVHCAAINYKTPASEKPAFQSVCWWDDTPFVTHLLSMLMMKEFTATVTFSEYQVSNKNRKLLASSTEEIVRKTFEPVIDPETYAKTVISD